MGVDETFASSVGGGEEKSIWEFKKSGKLLRAGLMADVQATLQPRAAAKFQELLSGLVSLVWVLGTSHLAHVASGVVADVAAHVEKLDYLAAWPDRQHYICFKCQACVFCCFVQ